MSSWFEQFPESHLRVCALQWLPNLSRYLWVTTAGNSYANAKFVGSGSDTLRILKLDPIACNLCKSIFLHFGYILRN
jgi:hypothetical protein